MTVTRPSARVLVVSEARAGALVRLAVWAAVVGIFLLVLLGAAGQPGDAAGAWLALLVPLVLLPYLVDGVRVLRHGHSCTFDGGSRQLRITRRAAVGFERIRHLEVGAVNGTCEECSLVVRLGDGAGLPVTVGQGFAPVLALAEEAAALVGVPVVRVP